MGGILPTLLFAVFAFLQSLFSCSHLSLRSLFFAVILLFSHCMSSFFAVIVLCSHGALQPWFFAVMVLCSVGNRCIDETSTKTFVSRKYINNYKHKTVLFWDFLGCFGHVRKCVLFGGGNNPRLGEISCGLLLFFLIDCAV